MNTSHQSRIRAGAFSDAPGLSGLRRLVLLTGILPAIAMAQVDFSWRVSAAPNERDDEFIGILTATLAPPWHIYSMTQPDLDGLETQIEIPSGQSVHLAGAIDVRKPEISKGQPGEADLEVYTGTVVFRLPLRATKAPNDKRKIIIKVSYQACSGENCLLPQTESLTAVFDRAKNNESNSTARKP